MSRGLTAASRHEKEVSDERQRRPSCSCKCTPTGRQSDIPPAPSPHIVPASITLCMDHARLDWGGLGPGVEGCWVDYLSRRAGEALLANLFDLMHAPQATPSPPPPALPCLTAGLLVFSCIPLAQPIEPIRRCLPVVPSAAWVPNWRNANLLPWLPSST